MPLLKLLLLLLCVLSAVGFRRLVPGLGGSKHSLKLNAIKNPALLNSLKNEYEASKGTPETPRVKELMVVVKCIKALEELESDLELMGKNISQDSPETPEVKASSEFFYQEFERCKSDIEGALNDILDSEAKRGQ